MQTLLIVVGILIILAIGAILYWRSKQATEALESAPDDMDVDAFAKPHDTGDIPHVAPAQVDKSASSILAEVQSLISQGRYEDASSALRRALMAHPKNAHLMLEMLKIQGLTDNHEGFTKWHAKIISTNDKAVIEEANELQSLMGDFAQKSPAAPEMALDESKHATPAPTKTEEDDALDFGDFNFNEPTPEPQADDALDFSDFESTADDLASQSEADSLDFDFSALESSTPAQEAPTELDEVLALEEDASPEPMSVPSLEDDVTTFDELQAKDDIPTFNDFENPTASAISSETTPQDGISVTLDLAEKYLEMGEHDSARRLLDEIEDKGTEAQNNKTALLLDRLG